MIAARKNELQSVSPASPGRVASLVEIRKRCNHRVSMVSPDQAARSGVTGPAGRDRVRQPSTFRIRIRPEAGSAHGSMGTVSAQGSGVRVLIRLRNPPLSLPMALVVRAGPHRVGSSRVKVNGRSPASSGPSATARHLFLHFPVNALRRRWISSAVPAWIMSRQSPPVSPCRRFGAWPGRLRCLWTVRRWTGGSPPHSLVSAASGPGAPSRQGQVPQDVAFRLVNAPRYGESHALEQDHPTAP